jgi:hypothetical protein
MRRSTIMILPLQLVFPMFVYPRYLLSDQRLCRGHEDDPTLGVPPVEVVHDDGGDERFAQAGWQRHLDENSR